MRVFGGAAHGASARSGAVRLVGALLGAALGLGVAGGTARATILQQFQGASLGNPGFIPPDMGGAVGNGDVVQLVNGVATIDTVTGIQISQTSLNTFFGGISGTLSDPRIVFDPSSQRWFASAITVPNGASNPNSILVAVSAGANPTGGFTTLSFASASSTTFADFPTLGVNGAAVTIGTNDFSTGTGSYNGSSLYSIPKSSLTAATPSLTNQSSFIQANSIGFAPQAATNAVGGGTSTTVLSVASTSAGQNLYAVSTVTGANAAGATLALGPTYAQPFSNSLVAPTQPGGTTYAPGDSRISSGAYQSGNYIYFANTVSNGANDEISWVILNATDGSVVASGLLTMPGMNLTYPSISANADGTFVIAFNGSGTANNIGDYYSVCSLSTAQCETPQLSFIGPSAANNYYNVGGGTINRWGDYSWTTVDPTNPNTFWLFQEYAATNSSWGTVITSISTAAPEPAGLSVFVAAMAGLGLVRPRKRCR